MYDKINTHLTSHYNNSLHFRSLSLQFYSSPFLLESEIGEAGTIKARQYIWQF